MNDNGETKSLHIKRKRKEIIISYSFILPFLIFITIFAFIPIVYLIWCCFQSGSIMGNMKFVRLDNFMEVFAKKDYFSFFLNSLIYVVFTIPIGQAISFILASLLKEKIRFVSIFMETTIFLPLLISMVGASIIISFLFAPNGPVNYIVILLGLEPINWLGTVAGARTVIILLELWKGLGLYVFVYLAALRGIPSDYYEVAKIEGAKSGQILFRITVPLMRRTIFFCSTMSFIWQVQIFDSVYTTTRGGPFETTKTIVYSIYETTFLKGKPGTGAVLSICFLIIILIITAFENYFSNKLENYEY